MDFLRASAITVVVLGHWLMAAPTMGPLEFTLSDMLHVSPWTQWLTWGFQVMPVFFLVGGWVNATSWQSARRDGRGYGAWISHRLQRLVWPLVPFVLVWAALAIAAPRLGLDETLVRSGSRIAFVPTWFLAVYLLVVVLAPAMHRLWERWGWAGFGVLVGAAAVVDGVVAFTGQDAVRWLNYVFVWLALHHLGFAWQSGRLAASRRCLALAGVGLLTLVLLVTVASYPVSMVTVPEEPAANANPPTLALLALGVAQAGLLLSWEETGRRWLRRPGPWAATVRVNGVILTVYLWHASVMVTLVALAEWPGGIGLGFEPGTAVWWATRPAWILALLMGLLVFVAAFGRVEARPNLWLESPPGAWRSALGALLTCVGLVGLSAGGVTGTGPLGLRVEPVLAALAGVALVVVRPSRGQPAAPVSSESPTTR
ncbi:MAG: acyltransferase family protein [Gemmatimonadota bacterium]